MAEKAVWNKGRSIGQMAPLSVKQVQTIKRRLQSEESKRDLALFIDTMLRGGDLLALTVSGVTDYEGQVHEDWWPSCLTPARCSLNG